MRLRNKKTGEITQDSDWDFVGLVLKVNHADDTIEMDDRIEYHSLAELNKDWEDYEPNEPFITVPTIRKAVRAWAEANHYDKLWIYHDHSAISFYNEDDGDNEITFNTVEKFGLEHLKCYTIIELCGEEE